MEKMLVAVDASEGSMKAVKFVARCFSGIEDLHICILHIRPELPTMFWDDGHILEEPERTERDAAIDRWRVSQRFKMANALEEAADILIKSGIEPERIESKTISDSGDVAETILLEAGNGHFQTIMMGRRGHSGISKFFMGSVSTKVVDHGTGMTICVVE